MYAMNVICLKANFNLQIKSHRKWPRGKTIEKARNINLDFSMLRSDEISHSSFLQMNCLQANAADRIERPNEKEKINR